MVKTAKNIATTTGSSGLGDDDGREGHDTDHADAGTALSPDLKVTSPALAKRGSAPGQANRFGTVPPATNMRDC
ncbi:hypothetical protein GA0070563_10284 [Micromonospora carbonacea]|uniref:Uncharacterized protein n=1 Tax=Micromonospora carbonacea TaxID=47853 RepID=A0A1C4V744_9ACTN|nr:hypothetical protein GA0070563_10284 [Micromonospora carbonacea]